MRLSVSPLWRVNVRLAYPNAVRAY
ncbi:hypothetical protein EMIT0111MI5_10432 [Burkholderia sp. IT-111MI5]